MADTLRPGHVVIVLGMHRSGTSCLTGTLQEAGLQLGEVSEWNKHNTKGNRESDRIMSLHESLLADNGGSWDQPPRRVRWNRQHYQQAFDILEENSRYPFWGFKDPRTLLALQGWHQLDLNCSYIGIFRHPARVARSLLKRGMKIHSEQQALDLWYRYNKRLLKAQKNLNFPLLCFDWDRAIFQASVEKVCKDIGLRQPVSETLFYDESLINQRGEETPLPWKYQRLYQRLCNSSEPYRSL